MSKLEPALRIMRESPAKTPAHLRKSPLNPAGSYNGRVPRRAELTMARPNHSYRRLLVLLFLGLIVCGLPCLFFAAQMGAFRTSRDTLELDGVPRQAVARPQPVSRQGYVGSGACRKCHAEISEKYARH